MANIDVSMGPPPSGVRSWLPNKDGELVETTPAMTHDQLIEDAARAATARRVECRLASEDQRNGYEVGYAEGYIAALPPVLERVKALEAFVKTLAKEALNSTPGDALSRRDMIIRARAALNEPKPLNDKEIGA